MQGYADRLFLLLAGLDFVWTCMLLAGEKPDLLSWFVGVFRKFMAIGIFLAILQFGPGWMQDIIDSFSKVGLQASHAAGGVTASSILADGMKLSTKLLAGAAVAGALSDFGSSLGYILAAATMAIAYTVICIHFVKAVIDTYLSVRAAFIFLGFGGSRWTSPYSERYITMVIAAGVRLMALYLIIGIGHGFSVSWWYPLVAALTSADGGISRAWSIACGTVIYASICWASPKFIAGLISGAPTLSGADVIGFATPMAQAGLAAGTFAATTAAGVAATVATWGPRRSSGCGWCCCGNPPVQLALRVLRVPVLQEQEPEREPPEMLLPKPELLLRVPVLNLLHPSRRAPDSNLLLHRLAAVVLALVPPRASIRCRLSLESVK
jgi:type IV secretion system protein TrbL